MIQTPTSVDLLPCEQIIVEAKTSNATPVNHFTRRAVGSFPSAPQTFSVYAVLTDGIGTGTMELKILRGDTSKEVHAVSGTIQCGNPLQAIRLMIRVRNCVFPIPGRYILTLGIDGVQVAQCAIQLL